MTPVYQIADRKDSRALTEYLAQNGQLLLPMVELIATGQMLVEQFLDSFARVGLEGLCPKLSG